MIETLRALIRECVLEEARTLMGIDLTDLSLSEIEELELYLSGNISLDSIESPVVKRRVTGMQTKNQKKQPDVFVRRRQGDDKDVVVKRKEPGNQPDLITKPNIAKPPPPMNRLINGQTMGKREHTVDLGMMNITNDYGDRLRIRHREKQQAPGYWIWDTNLRDEKGKVGDWVWVPGKTYGK